MKSKNLVLVGAGGFAKEALGYIEYENARGEDFNIKGILDDDLSKANTIPDRLKFLGTIKDYTPQEDEFFLVCVGSKEIRKKIINLLLFKNAKIHTFVSSLAYVSSDSMLGEGVFVAPYCMVNANAKLGDFSLMNSYSAIGHDSTIGENSILHPYAAINGDCIVGSDLVMGTRATIFPGTKVGNNCIITAHSYVKSSKGDNRFIHQKTKEIDLENRL